MCTIEGCSQVIQACTEAAEGLNLFSWRYFRECTDSVILKDLTYELHLLKQICGKN